MLTISPDNRLTITFFYKFYCQPIILWFCSPISPIQLYLLFQEKPPLNIRHTTGILISFNNYCSIRIPVYDPSRLWQLLPTAVTSSYHGRGKILPRPWGIADTGTFIEQYRYPERNYTSFPSYTSLLNQPANKLYDKRARLIINQKETSSYYFILWNIHHIY